MRWTWCNIGTPGLSVDGVMIQACHAKRNTECVLYVQSVASKLVNLGLQVQSPRHVDL
jgi:hypothetical protein